MALSEPGLHHIGLRFERWIQRAESVDLAEAGSAVDISLQHSLQY